MTDSARPDRWKLRFEDRITVTAMAGGIAGIAVALILLWTGDFTPKVQWTLTLLIAGCWIGFGLALRERLIRPLQTASNMLAALKEGDFSIRARGARRGDVLDDVFVEMNDLGETLHEQRLGALEATTLLRTVMSEIDVGIFAFDDEQRLRLVNRQGEKMLAQPTERLLGRTATELNLARCLAGDHRRPLPLSFPGGDGRWGIRVSSFREHGKPHQLLVMADLTRPLRAEEVQAWKRLVRVIGHELNNSLTPIMSIAGSLKGVVDRDPPPDDWREDMRDGLSVIGRRAESLGRFMNSYAKLARLPEPVLAAVNVAEWVGHVASIETRMPVEIREGPALTIQGDKDQLEQALINLVRNAVDASTESGGVVVVSWALDDSQVVVSVTDEGPGLSNTGNLFVPFFTTKPGGSGIGLALCRQIAEGHNGTVTLENRVEAPGCAARLRLPV